MRPVLLLLYNTYPLYHVAHLILPSLGLLIPLFNSIGLTRLNCLDRSSRLVADSRRTCGIRAYQYCTVAFRGLTRLKPERKPDFKRRTVSDHESSWRSFSSVWSSESVHVFCFVFFLRKKKNWRLFFCAIIIRLVFFRPGPALSHLHDHLTFLFTALIRFFTETTVFRTALHHKAIHLTLHVLLNLTSPSFWGPLPSDSRVWTFSHPS